MCNEHTERRYKIEVVLINNKIRLDDELNSLPLTIIFS
jgi:hypothetical protein